MPLMTGAANNFTPNPIQQYSLVLHYPNQYRKPLASPISKTKNASKTWVLRHSRVLPGYSECSLCGYASRFHPGFCAPRSAFARHLLRIASCGIWIAALWLFSLSLSIYWKNLYRFLGVATGSVDDLVELLRLRG